MNLLKENDAKVKEDNIILRDLTMPEMTRELGPLQVKHYILDIEPYQAEQISERKNRN